MALPGHLFVAQHRHEQIELLLEQLLVLGEIEAEQRKRLGERAAPDGDFGTAVGGGVQRREALEHADRVVGGKYGHRRTEPDALGARSDRRQHHFRRRHREIGSVVLADAEGIDAQRIGQRRLLDHVADDLRVAQKRPVGALGNVAERVQAEFKGLCHACS